MVSTICRVGRKLSGPAQAINIKNIKFCTGAAGGGPCKKLSGAGKINRGKGNPDKLGSSAMIQLTPRAIEKVKEILDGQDPKPTGLRIAVVGGGCSGFSYSMAFEASPNVLDKTYQFDGLKVFIDQASMLYLDGASVDFVETLEGAGFKFENPNVRSTCGCGSSFNV